MADSNVLNYVGTITGVIGAITGVSGAVMGLISYRRSGHMKALDLRIELRKAISDLHDSALNLSQTLENANNSFADLSKKVRTRKPELVEEWQAEFEADASTAQKISNEIPNPNASYDSLSHIELESELIAVHRHQSQVDRLLEKYRSSLAEDDKERERIRAEWARLFSRGANRRWDR